MSTSANLNSLLSTSLGATNAVTLNLPNVTAAIQAGLGIGADQVDASEVILVTDLLDDSGSIRFVAGNAQAVRDGHNGLLDAITSTKQTEGILFASHLLNGTVIDPFCALKDATRLDSHNYDPNGGTPLYDRTTEILGMVAAKSAEFEDNGVPCRTITVIVTDGADEHSRQYRAADVKKIVDAMLRRENHIIAGMGIDDGHTDFQKIFSEMGIRDEWILTPGNDPSSIRKAFALVSQSAIRASQTAGSFSQTALGGFGA